MLLDLCFLYIYIYIYIYCPVQVGCRFDVKSKTKFYKEIYANISDLSVDNFLTTNIERSHHKGKDC